MRPSKRVFDCFTYNGETDVLSIRLNELDSVVDVFVLVEADKTHAGHPRKIYYKPSQFPEFANKIRHIVVTDMPDDLNPWVRENFQRDAIMRGLYDANPNDLIIISDVDEILRAQAVTEMAIDTVNYGFGIALVVSNFYVNYRNVAGKESNTIWNSAAIFSTLKGVGPTALRLLYKGTHLKERIIGNGGWHFSYLTDLKGVKKKIEEFAHQECNTDYFKSTINIDKIVSERRDLLGREDYIWDVINDNDLPEWLLINKSSMKHLFYEGK